ncbi:MAG: PHP domain-containing protein, partial [bacterium]
MIDLHTHTFYSDGKFSPSEVVQRAKANGVRALAIADHDSWEGIPEAEVEGAKLGIEILSAIEFSTHWLGKELHILGYGMDYRDMNILEYVEGKRARNRERVVKLVKRFQELGFVVSEEEVFSRGKNSLKRVHAVLSVLEEPENEHLLRKHIPSECELSVGSIWKTFLSEGKLAFVPGQETPVELIAGLVHGAGGVISLAHPGLAQWKDAEADISQVVALGLDGIECFYS